MVLLNDMAAIWRLCLSFGLLLISANGATTRAYNTTMMTNTSSTRANFPHGISGSNTDFISVNHHHSQTNLASYTPATNTSTSASESFWYSHNVSTPNPMLLTSSYSSDNLSSFTNTLHPPSINTSIDTNESLLGTKPPTNDATSISSLSNESFANPLPKMSLVALSTSISTPANKSISPLSHTRTTKIQITVSTTPKSSTNLTPHPFNDNLFFARERHSIIPANGHQSNMSKDKAYFLTSHITLMKTTTHNETDVVKENGSSLATRENDFPDPVVMPVLEGDTKFDVRENDNRTTFSSPMRTVSLKYVAPTPVVNISIHSVNNSQTSVNLSSRGSVMSQLGTTKSNVTSSRNSSSTIHDESRISNVMNVINGTSTSGPATWKSTHSSLITLNSLMTSSSGLLGHVKNAFLPSPGSSLSFNTYNPNLQQFTTTSMPAISKYSPMSHLSTDLAITLSMFLGYSKNTSQPTVNASSTNLAITDLPPSHQTNVSSLQMFSLTSVAPMTPALSDPTSNYRANVYDMLTKDYVSTTPKQNSEGLENSPTDIDLSSLRKKFLSQFINLTNPATISMSDTTPSMSWQPTVSKHSSSMINGIPKQPTFSTPFSNFISSINSNPPNAAVSNNFKQNYSSFDSTTSTFPYTTTPFDDVTASILLSQNATTSANATSNVTRSINKEQLEFPGITLKVSHVLIPKQKRSRYNIQNMRIELPKTESLNQAPPSVSKASKNSNCTRFPVLVVTAADAESKEKVNLTEEHYDCEFSSQIQSSTRQKEPADSIRTYYGGYVFRYTIPKAPNASTTTNQSSTENIQSTETTTVEDNDDYYPSYVEYSDLANGSSNSGTVDDAIFPDPIIRNENILNQKTEAYSAPLTESTMIDNDLHDRDVIDSVMYIYFGGASHGLHGAGRQIIIVGAVIALVAQFLTLASSIRRIKTHQGEEPTIILLNVEIALTLTNLIFILGVQSTGSHTLCRMTAISLYYLHLVTLLWFLLSSLHCVQSVSRIKNPIKSYVFCICGWILPLIITLFSYMFNERSFETSLYCWISPLRGILFSYILPVIFLCSVCIVTTVYGLGRVPDVAEELDDTYSHRKLLRLSAVSLPLFSIIWFTGMISLENSSSLLFSMIYLISNTVLNWLLFGCWLPSEASQWKDMDEDYYDDDEDFDDEPVLAKRRFDDQPLLSELYEYGAQGQLYNLRIEPISIISAP